MRESGFGGDPVGRLRIIYVIYRMGQIENDTVIENNTVTFSVLPSPCHSRLSFFHLYASHQLFHLLYFPAYIKHQLRIIPKFYDL